MTTPAFVSIAPHKQIGGTCYAHAVATVIRATENRIIGRKPESHDELVKNIVNKHGSKGAYTYSVLKEECAKRQLRCKNLSEFSAIQAIKKRRPIIASFTLYDNQWDIFARHFNNNGSSILTKDKMENPGWFTTKTGHAICIIGINESQKYWLIKNSWGNNWADGGNCRVAFDAVTFKYYECYFNIEDLTKQDTQHPILKIYSSLTTLGKGTFGQVYKGIDLKIDEFVAIKKMNKTDYKSIQRELSLLNKCKCKYIIKLLNEHSYSNYHWIVLEYCSGGSIEGRAGKCNERELKKITFDVLQGLCYLHSQKIIHRDIKPSNILHSSHGIYKLADFGISKDINETLKRTLDIGTSYFMAPEIINHNSDEKGYDESVDIWSLGVTLYKLITNSFPYNFKKKAFLHIATTIVRQNTLKLTANLLNGFGDIICDIINNKCLVKDSKKRQQANELLTNSWFKIDDDEKKMETTTLISYCESIKDVVKNTFPHAYEVWQKQPEGTIAFLKGKGIIETQELLQEFDMPFKEGVDRIEAWKEYKIAIYEYLTKINKDERLQQARE
eukprot:726281_1